MTQVTVDNKGFVVVDGVKVCKVTRDGKLQFCDKDRLRSQQRGTRFVEVSPDTLASVARNSSQGERSGGAGTNPPSATATAGSGGDG